MTDFNNRRSFIKTCACAACATILPGCAGLQFVPNRLEGNQIVFDRKHFETLRCVGIDHPRLREPIAVCRDRDETLYAVAALCTHKGCELRFSNDRLECPCHGSTFAFDGTVKSKPAKENLRRFSVSVDQGRVYVGA